MKWTKKKTKGGSARRVEMDLPFPLEILCSKPRMSTRSTVLVRLGLLCRRCLNGTDTNNVCKGGYVRLDFQPFWNSGIILLPRNSGSQNGWKQRVSVKRRPDGGGWRMADDKMRIIKCGWKNAYDKKIEILNKLIN